jgi:hypothetical protein
MEIHCSLDPRGLYLSREHEGRREKARLVWVELDEMDHEGWDEPFMDVETVEKVAAALKEEAEWAECFERGRDYLEHMARTLRRSRKLPESC